VRANRQWWPRRSPSLSRVTHTQQLSVVVVGAGFGGIAAAVELRSRGVTDLTVLEKAERVGGVWRDNTYPGAACDVPSSLYSYSFAPNPDWPRRYAEQPDILAYIERVTREEGLADLVTTGTEVVAARWDTAKRRWSVETRRGTAPGPTYVADVVVFAQGQLSRPAVPDLPGREDFAGPAFHSAQWDHDQRWEGKRVAVIGTGASAIQFVPHLAREAAHVTVFQRSAPYVVPKPDRGYTRAHLRLFERLPFTQGFGRELTRTLSEQLNRTLGEQGRMTRLLEAAFRTHLWHQVRDPRLRAKLLPTYPIGCKRLLFSNDWYPALVRDDVDVVTHGVTGVDADGVLTDDGGHHAADVIVWGTGFRATEFLAPVEVTGTDGVPLAQEWRDGAYAHLGITVPGFPNAFIVYGPNTNLGGSSIISMIECQTGYLGQAVTAMQSGRTGPLEVRRDVADRYDAEMQDRLSRSVWASGCSSWYQTPGGRITTNWPGQVEEYRERTAELDLTDFVPHTTPAAASAHA
jgi:cation diffusion facilitator CzcD-associated flavoprotein CzcO